MQVRRGRGAGPWDFRPASPPNRAAAFEKIEIGYTIDNLRALKARYDPENLFHLIQNIPPSGKTAR